MYGSTHLNCNVPLPVWHGSGSLTSIALSFAFEYRCTNYALWPTLRVPGLGQIIITSAPLQTGECCPPNCNLFTLRTHIQCTTQIGRARHRIRAHRHGRRAERAITTSTIPGTRSAAIIEHVMTGACVCTRAGYLYSKFTVGYSHLGRSWYTRICCRTRAILFVTPSTRRVPIRARQLRRGRDRLAGGGRYIPRAHSYARAFTYVPPTDRTPAGCRRVVL